MRPQRPHRTRPVSSARPPSGLAGRPPLHVGVLEQHPLVLLEPLPVDVTFMVVADEHVPLGHRFVVPGGLHGAPIDKTRPPATAAECIGAGIERIVQHLHDAVVGRLAPLDPADDAVAPDDGQLQGGIADPQEDLPRAAEFLELGEDELDGTLNPLVRIQLDAPVLAPDQARRQREAERAAAGLAVPGGEATLSEQAELVFGHRPFQAEQ
jgi:hypothetical protein